MTRVALITGITGQDGSYLSEFLKQEGYEVHGILPCKTPGVGELPARLHYGDLADGGNFLRLHEQMQPDELYNRGTQSQVRLSFPLPGYTLALDFPVVDGLMALFERLDDLVLAAGGRVYLSKDMHLDAGRFREMYPQFERWLAVKERVDPEGRFATDLGRRLGLVRGAS